MSGSILSRVKAGGRRLPLVPLISYYAVNIYIGVKKVFLLGGERLTREQKALLELNRLKWAKLDVHESQRDGYVLMDALLDNPIFYLASAVVGKHIGYKKNLGVLFLLPIFHDRKAKKICASYRPDGFVYLNLKRLDPGIRSRSFRDARRICRETKTGEELLKLEYEGILIGDLIYDSYLRRTREGTIDKVGPELFGFIHDAVMTKKYYDKLFRKYKISAVVMASMAYTEGGLLARVAVKNGVEVYLTRRKPPVSLTVRRYRDMGEIRTYDGRPGASLVDYIYDECQEEAVKAAEVYLKKRMEPEYPELKGVDYFYPYGSSKTLLGKDEVVEMLGLNARKPMVVIMSHALTDAVHSSNWWLFRDYLTWLRETLGFVRNCDNANWLVKVHPHAETYDCRQKEEQEVERITRGLSSHTIRLLPKDINSKSLLDFADVIITARGSAGLEFSCFGIPCILAAESVYSGFGFSIEPGSREEYFEMLRKVEEIGRLSAEEINRAKVLAYIHFILLGADTSFLSPDMPHIGKFDWNKLWWGEMYKNTQKTDPLADPFYMKFDKFLDSDATHLLNRPEFYNAKGKREQWIK
ncbi:hypothetical protein ACFLXF_04050 [Chloroflexota bacterium]